LVPRLRGIRSEKDAGRLKAGDMQLILAKADPKHNRLTLQVLANDKSVEKRDRSINEPLQVNPTGNRQLEEIVVNEVKKDRSCRLCIDSQDQDGPPVKCQRYLQILQSVRLHEGSTIPGLKQELL
jgi:hypothetical protein